MSETEPVLARELQKITQETRLQREKKEARGREEREARERVAKEEAEQAFSKNVSELEDWALLRAKKRLDWFKIGSLDRGKDIDPVSWKNIDFDYTKLKSSMVRGELKRLVDHFEKKGLRIIFGQYDGEHDYFDPDYYFVAASWGDRKTIRSSLYGDTGDRTNMRDKI